MWSASAAPWPRRRGRSPCGASDLHLRTAAGTTTSPQNHSQLARARHSVPRSRPIPETGPDSNCRLPAGVRPSSAGRVPPRPRSTSYRPRAAPVRRGHADHARRTCAAHRRCRSIAAARPRAATRDLAPQDPAGSAAHPGRPSVTLGVALRLAAAAARAAANRIAARHSTPIALVRRDAPED